MRLAVVIAAYNEASSIVQTLKSIPRHIGGISKLDIIVVNDGSSDATEELALKSGAFVLSHPINRGQGAALQTGLEYVRDNGYDIVVTFDADGQHSGREIHKIIQPILDGRTKVVLGSRFIGKTGISQNIPLSRRLVLKGGILFTRIFSRINVTDTHNGFRAISVDVLDKLRLNHDRMEHASELLDLISRYNISFSEVPVTITYTEYSKAKGQSNGNALRIAVRMLLYKLAQ